MGGRALLPPALLLEAATSPPIGLTDEEDALVAFLNPLFEGTTRP